MLLNTAVVSGEAGLLAQPEQVAGVKLREGGRRVVWLDS